MKNRTKHNIWVWRRLVARYLGVVEAASSSLVTQTMLNVHNGLNRYEHSFFMHISVWSRFCLLFFVMPVMLLVYTKLPHLVLCPLLKAEIRRFRGFLYNLRIGRISQSVAFYIFLRLLFRAPQYGQSVRESTVP